MRKPRPPRAPAARKDAGKLLRIAGLPAVSALFATAPERVERLFFDDRMKPLTGAFCTTLARARKPYRIVPPDELERIAGTVLHGGIVALAGPRALPELDLAAVERWAADGQPLLLLDGIGNPHNLGAIVRSAAFFGLPRIVLSDHPEQAGPSDASYRVAEGGLEHVALFRAARFAASLKGLRRFYRVLGTALGKGHALDALHRGEKPLALVLGNEEDGLPRATLDACDAVVTIPGAGNVQSLNVSASAAILIYAVRHLADTDEQVRPAPAAPRKAGRTERTPR
jgi:TrmH RNA methyltransferase